MPPTAKGEKPIIITSYSVPLATATGDDQSITVTSLERPSTNGSKKPVTISGVVTPTRPAAAGAGYSEGKFSTGQYGNLRGGAVSAGGATSSTADEKHSIWWVWILVIVWSIIVVVMPIYRIFFHEAIATRLCGEEDYQSAERLPT